MPRRFFSKGRGGSHKSIPLTPKKPRTSWKSKTFDIEGGKIVKGKRLAQLTGAEDRAWNDFFGYYVDEEGLSDTAASRRAWRDMQDQFPRLKKFDGALPS